MSPPETIGVLLFATAVGGIVGYAVREAVERVERRMEDVMRTASEHWRDDGERMR